MASIIVVRPSIRTSIGTCSRPTSSQSATTVVVSGPAGVSSPSATTKAAPIPRITGMCDNSLSHRPPAAATRAPSRGKNGISQAE